jgi:hypothetical protein
MKFSDNLNSHAAEYITCFQAMWCTSQYHPEATKNSWFEGYETFLIAPVKSIWRNICSSENYILWGYDASVGLNPG